MARTPCTGIHVHPADPCMCTACVQRIYESGLPLGQYSTVMINWWNRSTKVSNGEALLRELFVSNLSHPAAFQLRRVQRAFFAYLHDHNVLYGHGYGYITLWMSQDVFLNNASSVNMSAVYGSWGVLALTPSALVGLPSVVEPTATQQALLPSAMALLNDEEPAALFYDMDMLRVRLLSFKQAFPPSATISSPQCSRSRLAAWARLC